MDRQFPYMNYHRPVVSEASNGTSNKKQTEDEMDVEAEDKRRDRRIATSLLEREECLLLSLLTWYNADRSRVEAFSEIITRRSGLSLRIIDWLSTNYSKTVQVVIMSQDGVPTDLYSDYHKLLSAYNKRMFDPFSRRRRIELVVLGKVLEVSIAQMNYFKWFISKDLVAFLIKNRNVVESHMKASENNRKAAKDTKKVEVAKVAAVAVSPMTFSGSFVMHF
jgi:hypothetical protein